ncbi:stalk domain-containing protein [Bacillus sp. FJAT-28004]|uniref:stalk domain-containing protein n=1 Tax=Bacillus sp. FJAT-28004 TaxID=1679165 RepID=UPI0006B546C3|nr:stalk domain-containing protein [Bacillus sp. FJAT-28004]
MYSKFRKAAFRAVSSVMLTLLLITAFFSPLCVNSLVNNTSITYAASELDKKVEDHTYRIVAVGDSLTAGYEYGFTEQSIPYGFVEHVYEQALFHGLRAEYTNYGVLGLRTTGLKKWVEAIVNGVSVKSADIQSGLPDPRAERIFAETVQLRSALSEADLIVMTIGGNDMYAVLDKLNAKADHAETTTVLDKALDTYESELEPALRLLLTLQPNAQIVIADQYLPIPPPLKVGAFIFPLYPEADRLFLQDSIKQLRERLNQVIERVTKDGYHVKVANVASSFIDNELSYTSIAQGDIHPSRAGYAAMGKSFTKAIWGDYRVVKPKENGAALAIVVSGKEMISAIKPIIVQNRTFVPLRSIAGALGATTKWNAAAQTATIKVADRSVDITVGAASIRDNGVSKTLNTPPAFIHTVGKVSTLYVPLAALSEGLQFQVIYRDTLKTVFINK